MRFQTTNMLEFEEFVVHINTYIGNHAQKRGNIILF